MQPFSEHWLKQENTLRDLHLSKTTVAVVRCDSPGRICKSFVVEKAATVKQLIMKNLPFLAFILCFGENCLRRLY